MMYFIGVDLGSTNIKAGLYDASMGCVKMESVPVVYDRSEGHVEFDAEAYVASLTDILRTLTAGRTEPIDSITFTGQAESLVILGQDGKPLMNVISWMDERSTEECAAMEARFPGNLCYAHTGQPAALPTWPATKILWLRSHRPDLYEKAAHYVLLKDYVVYSLTGKLLADRSIATFTFYFDIYEKCYWQEMLDFIGVSESQLPPLAEPCTIAGPLTESAAAAAALPENVQVNLGTLDHFAGMVGTGNVQAGGMSLSTGTVMGLSTMAASPVKKDTGIPMHYGFLPDTYVMLPVAESGGVSLEWFKRACMPNVSYDELNQVLLERPVSEILFLPYLVGTNAPEFDLDACGMFYGLRSQHDAFDMALAVMEGVSHLLKKNCDHIQASGTPISRIIATGGGAKSPVWCQMQADITGIPVEIPAEKEAACLGAAIIGAVAGGVFPSYEAAAKAVVRMEKRFLPRPNPRYQRKHRQYLLLYEAMLAAKRMEDPKSAIEIRLVPENKKQYLDLLLIADEQEDMIDLYLDRGDLYVLEDAGELRALCVVTDEGDRTCEIKNIVTVPDYQNKGYGKALVKFVCDTYRGRFDTVDVGTGDSPLTIPFYERCGFREFKRVANFFIDHYDHPMFECGKQLIDMVYLQRKL